MLAYRAQMPWSSDRGAKATQQEDQAAKAKADAAAKVRDADAQRMADAASKKATAPAPDRNRVIRKGRSVTVENLTGEVIESFYATNKFDDVWDMDLLGKNVIQPGARHRIVVDDYSDECRFDMRVRTESNRVIESSGDACGAGLFWSVR